MEERAVLTLDKVRKWFPIKGRRIGEPKSQVRAVNDVSLQIFEGETLGIVGESGCGKTTLGRLMIRLNRVSRGRILYEDTDITDIDEKKMKAYRKDLQIISLVEPGSARPVRSPLMSERKTGTPAALSPSASNWSVRVLPVPVAPVTRA